MNKKVLFVLFAILMMAVMTVSVSADQDGYNRYCNTDQYGCWVTGENGAQDYIMFWSESARTYFMGPNSNATVTEYPTDSNGKLGMSNGAPESQTGLSAEERAKIIAAIVDFYIKKDYETGMPKELEGSERVRLNNKYSKSSDSKLNEWVEYFNKIDTPIN